MLEYYKNNKNGKHLIKTWQHFKWILAGCPYPLENYLCRVKTQYNPTNSIT